MEFLAELKARNGALFYFSLLNLAAALVFLLLSQFKPIEIIGANGWFKPTKFALSTALFCIAMAWYGSYLKQPGLMNLFNLIIILCLGFEVAYIAFQASKGEISHYNSSSPFYSFMFTLMAGAASIATLMTAWIGLRFFLGDFPELPPWYLWAIRLGILLFVVFSFEGFAMGARGSHTVGGPDGGPGWQFLGWSFHWGDLRIAHFVGMHALQVLPLLAWFFLKNTRATLLVSGGYAVLAIGVLVLALQGKPLITKNNNSDATLSETRDKNP